MSAWIAGHQIVADLGLIDFEFVREFVAKDIVPHNEHGQPFMPANVVEQSIQGLEEEINQHEDTALSLTGYEREEIIAKYIEPLKQQIQSCRAYHHFLNGKGWDSYELPQDKDLAHHFIQVLLNSLYRRDEVYKRLSPESEPVPNKEPVQTNQNPAHTEQSEKQRKLRPEQQHKQACRAIAERLWKQNPEITINDMAYNDEINKACVGKHYRDDKTIRNWIKDLCPNRRPGRRKKKPS